MARRRKSVNNTVLLKLTDEIYELLDNDQSLFTPSEKLRGIKPSYPEQIQRIIAQYFIDRGIGLHTPSPPTILVEPKAMRR